MLRALLNKTALAAAIITAVGCSAAKPEKEIQEVYPIAFQRNAPEPAYNRLRWVYSPDPLPVAEPRRVASAAPAPALKPVFHLQLQNATYEEAARVLAAMSRYSSYCSSSLKNHKLNVNSLGTIDELAATLSQNTGVLFSVDHQTRAVRVVDRPYTARAEQPALFGGVQQYRQGSIAAEAREPSQ